METREIVTLLVSSFSACGAICAAFFARAAVQNQRHIQRWVANNELLALANQMLCTDPGLLQLHGITPEELEGDGVSTEELVYTLFQLNAGSAFYAIAGEQQVQLTEYRKNFLNSNKVRTIWKKYARVKLFNKGPFAQAVDAYIAEIETVESGK